MCNDKDKGNFQRNFICHFCNKTFKYNWMLTSHPKYLYYSNEKNNNILIEDFIFFL